MAESQLTLPLNERIAKAAHTLALKFTEDAELPARFRRARNAVGRRRKFKENAEIEIRFRANVDAWGRLIETMIAKLDQAKAWRFLNSRPVIDGPITRLTQCKDFCDFIDYMSLRRDKDGCNADELGGLALLSVSLQREIEKQIQ